MASLSVKNIARAIYESSYDKEGASLSDVIEKSAIWIRDKNLISKKEEILKALEDIINKEEGIIKAKVTVKNKLSKEEEDEIKDFIKKKYKAKEITLEIKEEEKLLGGIKIEVGNDIIDTTLQNKLHQLQNYLITN